MDDHVSVSDSDWAVPVFFDALESEHPETYAKLMADTERVGTETGDEYSRNHSARWIEDHSEQMQAVYDAVFSGLSDGMAVGTSGAAYKYVLRILDKLEWDDGSKVQADPDDMSLFINYFTLLETGDRVELYNDPLSRRDRDNGFDSEYDSAAALERFYDQLKESGYAVD